MNHVLHIAAVTQSRLDTDGRTYYRRKRAEGKKHMEATRCLKRRISDALYRQLVAAASAAVRQATAAGPGAHRGASQIPGGRLTPAYRHFGSATSRTRTNDATPERNGWEEALKTAGCQQKGAAVSRPQHD